MSPRTALPFFHSICTAYLRYISDRPWYLHYEKFIDCFRGEQRRQMRALTSVTGKLRVQAPSARSQTPTEGSSDSANTSVSLATCHLPLTVDWYRLQSDQKARTENLVLMVRVMPWHKHWPSPTIPPLEWYNGSEQ